MTIRELYEMAVAKGAEDYELVIHDTYGITEEIEVVHIDDEHHEVSVD